MLARLALLFMIALSYTSFSEAGQVIKTKGKKVYIIFDQSEGGTFANGDIFHLTDASGKKRGMVELKKVKGLKAIGLLKKGKADKGNTTLFRSEGKKKMKKLEDDVAPPEENPDYLEAGSKTRTRWGGMFGYGMAKQDVNQGTSTSAQSGSSMSVKFVYDYPLFDNFIFRGMGGVEMFSVSGTGIPITGGTTPAGTGTDITYITGDALLKWNFVEMGSKNIYFLVGGGILYPMSKSSDIIVADSIESLAIGEFGIGFDFMWGSWQIPIDFTYYYFPSGEDVDTNVMSIKFGILF